MWCTAIVKCKTLTHHTFFPRCAFFLRQILQVIYLEHWKIFQSHILPGVFTMKKELYEHSLLKTPTFPMRHSIVTYGGFTPNFTEMKHLKKKKKKEDWTQRKHWLGRTMPSHVCDRGCQKLENNLIKLLSYTDYIKDEICTVYFYSIPHIYPSLSISRSIVLLIFWYFLWL